MDLVDYVLEQEFDGHHYLLSIWRIMYYTYTITPAYQDFSFGYDIEDTIVDEYTKTVGGTQIQVTEYLIEESNQQEFSAEFEYKDVVYILTGIIEKDEFEKILENLHFF